MTLSGRVAVVTGAGRGIGEAIAWALSREGAVVALAARSAEQLERVAAAIRAGGGSAETIACDVTDPESVSALGERVEGTLGPADILVNNAGVSSADPLLRTTLEEWERVLRVNATGSFLCLQAFLPGMIARGWGRVVNVASVAGLTGGRYISAYAASKHAQIGLTRAAAVEVADKGVTVNAVCPGFVDTPMTDETLARIVEKTGRTREEALAALTATSPLGRLIQPDEVAHAVVSLCASAAAGINGQAIVLDGGAFMG